MASDRSITPEPAAGSGAVPGAPSPAEGEGGAHAPREGSRTASGGHGTAPGGHGSASVPGGHGSARHASRARGRTADSEAGTPAATGRTITAEAPADGSVPVRAHEPTGATAAAAAPAPDATDAGAPEAGAPEAGAAEEPAPQAGAAGEPAPQAGAAGEPTPQAGAAGEPAPEPGALEELAARAAKADEYLALAQRTKADFDNFRRRAAREAAAAQERGAVRLALELLPAIDNLERALAHAESEGAGDGCGDDSFVAGIRHVHADVIAALGRAGIECYSPDGERFDPQLHEAVAQQPTEGAEPGVIVEVYQRGYRIGDSVVRPARVVVAG